MPFLLGGVLADAGERVCGWWWAYLRVAVIGGRRSFGRRRAHLQTTTGEFADLRTAARELADGGARAQYCEQDAN